MSKLRFKSSSGKRKALVVVPMSWLSSFAHLLEKVFQRAEASSVKVWTPMIHELCKDEHLNSISVFV